MDYVIWLLITISSFGEMDIERYKSAALCEERVRDYAPYRSTFTVEPVCVHAREPWRRITSQGPNNNELWAREREAKGLSTFTDPFKPKSPQ